MTGFTVEQFPTDPFGSSFDVEDLIRHGLKTGSQMVVYLKENIKEYLIFTGHYYTLVGMKNNKVMLYDLHGRIFAVPSHAFFSNVHGVDICYFENNIFKNPEIETSVELYNNWADLESTEN